MLNEIMKMLQWLGEEVEYAIFQENDGSTYVQVNTNDFIGFTEDWDEKYRDVDYTKIDQAKKFLKHKAVECYCPDDDLYEWYYFSDCTVCWGATSYDI